MEFRLLGPLEVLGDDGVPVPLGGRRPRALLARLLLEPNAVVSTDRLMDAVWGESPPASAQSALQVHVHAVRQALGAERIETRPPGYRLRVEPDELDVERFHALVARGDAAALAEALSLWRGPALADLADEAFARADAARLDDARLAALEARIDADLEAGRHDVLTGELEGLAATHPHRERFHAQRMIALYRAGRQADALAAYQDARSALDELGLEPSGDLRALEQRILRQDASLDVPVTRAAPAPASPPGTCLDPDRPGARARGRVGAPRPSRHPPRHPHGARWNGKDAPRTGAGTDARRRWARRLRRSLVRERRLARAAHDRSRARRGRGARRGSGRDGRRRPRRAAAAAGAGQLRAGPRRGSRRRSAPRPRRGVEGARDEQGAAAHHGGARVPRSPASDPGARRRLAARRRDLGRSSALRRACPQEPPRLRRHRGERRRRGADLSRARRVAARARAGRRPREVARGGRDRGATGRQARAALTRGTRSPGAAALAPRRDRLERAAARRAGAIGVGRAGGLQRRCDPGRDRGGRGSPGSTFPLRSTTCWTRRSSRGRRVHGGETRFTMLETVREYATELLGSSGSEHAIRDRHLDWFLSQVRGRRRVLAAEHRRRLARAGRRGSRQLPRGALACPSDRRRRAASSVWPPRSATSGGSAGTSRRAATASTKPSSCPKTSRPRCGPARSARQA